MTRSNALGEYLRARRELVDPAAAGLRVMGVRRTPGLRREEVATALARLRHLLLDGIDLVGQFLLLIRLSRLCLQPVSDEGHRKSKTGKYDTR